MNEANIEIEIDLGAEVGAEESGPSALTPKQLDWLRTFLGLDLSGEADNAAPTGQVLEIDFDLGSGALAAPVAGKAGGAPAADAPALDAQAGGATQPQASCVITIKNSTHSRITTSLSDTSPTAGNFQTFPQTSINPGDKTVFNFVSEAGPNESQGCVAKMQWLVAWPDGLTPPVQRNSAALWSIGWVNAVGGQNSVSQQIFSNVPSGLPDFTDSNAAGAGDVDVPFIFEIIGGPEGPAKPVPPVPPVPPTPLPTTQERDPTLRPGDHSADGWVEYLQELVGVPQTGTYDPATVEAVRQFQSDKKLQVDGVVGNQTWAALRHGTPEAVGTDGHKPHTFVDHGPKGRWEVKDEFMLVLLDDGLLNVASVGDGDLAGFKGTVIITDSKGNAKEFGGVIGPKLNPKAKDEGALHDFRVAGVLSGLGLTKDSDFSGFVVDAFLEQAIGGDHAQGKMVVV